MSQGTDVFISAFLKQGVIEIPDPTDPTRTNTLPLEIDAEFDTQIVQETVPGLTSSLFTRTLPAGTGFLTTGLHLFADQPVIVTLIPDGIGDLAKTVFAFNSRDVPIVPLVEATEFIQVRVDNTANALATNALVEVQGLRVREDRIAAVFSVAQVLLQSQVETAFLELFKVRQALGSILAATAAQLPPEQQEPFLETVKNVLATSRLRCPVLGKEE